MIQPIFSRACSFFFIIFLIVITVLATPSLNGSASVGNSAQPERQNVWFVDFDDDTSMVLGPGTDQAYTAGFRIGSMSEQFRHSSWAQHLPFYKPNESAKFTSGLIVAQQIYTPDNSHVSEPIIDDRPYAAWLYVGMTSQWMTANSSELLEFDLGFVGPRAEGGFAQNSVHRLIGDELAQGWGNQIHNEPTVQSYYQTRLKHRDAFAQHDRLHSDLISYYGAALGNVAVKAHAGVMIRVSGGELSEDFGPTRVTSEEGDTYIPFSLGAFREHDLTFFVSARVTGIARNIFLDGNTFNASHHVTKIPIVATSEVGLTKQWPMWSLTWRYVTNTPDFAEKPELNSFAALSLAHFY